MESIKVNKETDKNITTKDIIEITKGTLISGNESTVCKKFSKDTRTIEKGDIYIGIKGENFDGNLFWDKALDNGALGVIIQDIEFSKEDIEKYKLVPGGVLFNRANSPALVGKTLIYRGEYPDIYAGYLNLT